MITQFTCPEKQGQRTALLAKKTSRRKIAGML
jgi:hypothetical protein